MYEAFNIANGMSIWIAPRVYHIHEQCDEGERRNTLTGTHDIQLDDSGRSAVSCSQTWLPRLFLAHLLSVEVLGHIVRRCTQQTY